ncbi:MAG: hypothetical protein OXF41_08295 [bacterium]|nr:hypothetical protein [bacterium]
MARRKTIDFLITYDHDTRKQISLEEFRDTSQALTAYSEREEEYRDNPRVEVVLLGAESEEAIRITHSNYFEDTTNSVGKLIADVLQHDLQRARSHFHGLESNIHRLLNPTTPTSETPMLVNKTQVAADRIRTALTGVDSAIQILFTRHEAGSVLRPSAARPFSSHEETPDALPKDPDTRPQLPESPAHKSNPDTYEERTRTMRPLGDLSHIALKRVKTAADREGELFLAALPSIWHHTTQHGEALEAIAKVIETSVNDLRLILELVDYERTEDCQTDVCMRSGNTARKLSVARGWTDDAIRQADKAGTRPEALLAILGWDLEELMEVINSQE